MKKINKKCIHNWVEIYSDQYLVGFIDIAQRCTNCGRIMQTWFDPSLEGEKKFKTLIQKNIPGE